MIGHPSPPHTVWSFDFSPPFGSLDTTGNIPFLRRLAAVRWAFRRVASIMMRSASALRQRAGEDAVEHARRLRHETVVECIVRTLI